MSEVGWTSVSDAVQVLEELSRFLEAQAQASENSELLRVSNELDIQADRLYEEGESL